MIFGSGYYGPMDREYELINLDSYPALEEPIRKEPVVGTSEMGISVTEGGRFGPFGQTVQSAIRLGVGKIELATGLGGGAEPVGAESYGKEAREELREIARANEIQYTSVHAPSQIGNLSGYNPQQGNFSDEFRNQALEEVKAAIKFAGDIGGSAVVVHTGEFARPITGRWDNEKYQFAGYPEEAEKAVAQMVDDRTGRILMQVRKSEIVYRPKWLTADRDYEGYDQNGNKVMIRKGDYIDYENRKVVDESRRVPVYNPRTGRFEVEPKTWADFEREAAEKNRQKEIEYGRALRPDEIIKPEEEFLRAQVQSSIDQARGWALHYSQGFEDLKENIVRLKKAKEFWEKIEKETDEKEKWRLKRQFEEDYGGLVPAGTRYPSEILNEKIKILSHQMESLQQQAVSYEQQAKENELILKHAKPVERYAIEKSLNSYAEAGIFALKETRENPNVKRDIFIAPENVFPEMGYGSHPEELIELVQGARKRMVQFLTERFIDGKPNPYYDGSISKKEAEELAQRHIKATFDTQHLGMWWRHFVPLPGESEEERRKRFNKWYMEEVEKLEKAGIIGHLHIVDSMGGGHHHLPAGEGDLPVVDAIEYLKKKGYGGTMISEGFEENMKYGAARQLEATWKAFGSPIYGQGIGVPRPGAPMRFSDIHQSYFGLAAPPNYIFGAYSPSNDWTLWSQVPLE